MRRCMGEAACTLDHGVEDDPHEEPPPVGLAGWLRALSGAVDRPTLSRWGRVLVVEAAGAAHELFRPGVW